MLVLKLSYYKIIYIPYLCTLLNIFDRFEGVPNIDGKGNNIL